MESQIPCTDENTGPLEYEAETYQTVIIIIIIIIIKG
jgi:hypothetical protein